MTLDEFMTRAKRLVMRGNTNVMLCERGSYQTDNKELMRNIPDIGGIGVLTQQMTHLPVGFDPSHSMGDRNKIFNASLAAIAAGATYLIVETHPNPHLAKTDGKQSLYPEQFTSLVKAAREQYALTQRLRDTYPLNASLENQYKGTMPADKVRLEL